MIRIVLFLLLISSQIKSQELWQFNPWAPDSTYVIGANGSGEPQWVSINEISTKIDSVKYENDSLYIYTPDSTFIVEIISGGGGGSGTVKGTGVNNKIAIWAASDSLKYDSLYFNPTNHILGIGTDSPSAVGGSFGVHVSGGNFATLRLTNNIGGLTASDGQNIYSYADSLYVSNLENGAIITGINSAEEMRVDANGLRIDALKTGGSPPTTSGSTRMVISDAVGRLSMTTIPTGTVTSHTLALGTSGTSPNISGTNPVTSSGTTTINIPTANGTNTGNLLNTDWTTFNNKVGGSGTSTRVAFWSGTSTLSSNSNLFWDNSNNRLGIGTSSPTLPLHVEGRGYFNVGTDNLFLNGGNTSLSGTSNFALGAGTLTSLTSGYQNVGIGVGAAPVITTGYANFAMGADALDKCVGCYSNVAIGNQSLFTNVSGFRNIAIGQEALAFTTTDASTAVGFYALRGQTTGLYNTGIGYFSAYQNQTGSGNVSAGFFSGPVSGSNNSIFGYYAGSGTTGNGNVIIGNEAGGGTLTQSNTLYIANSSSSSNGIYGNFSNSRFGINTAPASLARTLHVTGEVRITDLVTDNPTWIVGADNDGDLNRIQVSTGLQLVGNTLSVNGVGTVTQVNTADGITGGPIIGSGTVGLTGNALSLHQLSTNGIIARTGPNTVTAREIQPNTSSGQFGISVTNGNAVAGNPQISLLSNYAFLSGANDQTLSTTYTKYNFASGDDGDDTGLVSDIANDEIDIVSQGLYMYNYSINCKSNTASHTFSARMQNVGSGASLGSETKHVFNNTSDYCHNNGVGTFSMTAGNSVSLYVKTSTGTPNINDCQINLVVRRID